MRFATGSSAATSSDNSGSTNDAPAVKILQAEGRELQGSNEILLSPRSSHPSPDHGVESIGRCRTGPAWWIIGDSADACQEDASTVVVAERVVAGRDPAPFSKAV